MRHKIEPPPPADRSSTPSPVDKAKQQQREKIESGRVGGILQRGLQRRYSLISDILNEERE